MQIMQMAAFNLANLAGNIGLHDMLSWKSFGSLIRSSVSHTSHFSSSCYEQQICLNCCKAAAWDGEDSLDECL